MQVVDSGFKSDDRAGEIETKDAVRGFVGKLEDGVPPGLQILQPMPQRQGVMLAEGLDIANLEAHGLGMLEGNVDRVKLAIREHVSSGKNAPFLRGQGSAA